LKKEILSDGMYEVWVKGTKTGLFDAKKVINNIDKAFEDVK